VTDMLPEEVQRWTAKRRSALILSIIRGETSVQEAARRHGLTVAEVEDWREKFLAAAENALRSRPKDDEALKTSRSRGSSRRSGSSSSTSTSSWRPRKGRPFDRETSDE
jgi:transposase-like protein